MRIILAAIVFSFITTNAVTATDPVDTVREYREWKRVNADPITPATIDITDVVFEAGGG